MTERSVVHGTFTIERTYNAPPARVFAAMSSAKEKSQWFGGNGPGEPSDLQLDFRVGGRETTSGGAGGDVYKYEALYADIVPAARVVATYNMWLNEDLISVSVATTELQPDGPGTRLTYTEHGAFLDGLDEPHIREHGTRELFEKLSEYLQRKETPTPAESGRN
ncbi:MAG: SRPBCC family protein [Candidatus Eremiobacteraeota bacterium]|nr:SRPBCC family protein [Candidatus Eremiobacteraeota bacterium]